MANILIVCTGNICRSPVAVAILRNRLEMQGLTGWKVSSAGTWALEGERASTYGVELMAEYGMPIDDHRSRSINEEILSEADLVLCMEIGHVEALKAEFPRHGQKIYLLTEMSGQYYSVSDPYGGPKPAYERMIREVTTLIEDGLPRIVALAGQLTNPR